MDRIKLSDQDEWKLVDDDQDIRGWPVRDESGTEVGRVADLMVNEAEERVDTLVLEDGREVAARDVRIGDDAVYLGGTGSTGGSTTGDTNTVTVYDDYGRVVRREQVEGASGSASGLPDL